MRSPSSHGSALLEGTVRVGDVKDQLDRASTSIPLNIAEGNGKYTLKDRCRFFDTAHGSALECARRTGHSRGQVQVDDRADSPWERKPSKNRPHAHRLDQAELHPRLRQRQPGEVSSKATPMSAPAARRKRAIPGPRRNRLATASAQFSGEPVGAANIRFSGLTLNLTLAPNPLHNLNLHLNLSLVLRSMGATPELIRTP